ncbi:MAG: GntR family transcriptional regulator [Proteobacteria bacterium]|nr:GntR family transcriptional regulator [Pseudomonadota bacterium]
MYSNDNGDSKTDAAYQLLRQEILAARLPADMALRPTALNKAYGLSWTPVREALARLEAERLVVYQRNRGFSVAPVSSGELDDLRRARQAIELPLLKEAMEHGDAEWEAALVAAHHRLIRCTLPVDDRSEETLAHWEQMHEAFHKALLQAAVSKWLLRFQAQIAEQLMRHHRVLAILPALEGNSPESRRAREALRDALGPEHHTELLHAVLDRDVDKALALMAEHTGATMGVFERTNAMRKMDARGATRGDARRGVR